jgi:hypothetical protein
MCAFRFSKIGFLLSGSLIWVMAAGSAAAAKDLHQLCRQLRNDDAIRQYSPDLHDATVKAFRKLAPHAKGTPDDAELQAQAQYRCMNSKVMVCFVGANLPCATMNASRDNPGADEYCKANPNDDVVPAVATGHDAVYSYKCHDGKAEIIGNPWKLDKRGFAKELWTALPDH